MKTAAALRIAVVEDEAILALQLESLIEELGHEVAGAAASLAEADELAGAHPDLALVDVHLADGPTGVAVARHLAEAGVAVVFMTANLKRLPDDFAGAIGAIGKPYTLGGVEAALHHVAGLVRGQPGFSEPPASFLLAPARDGA